MARLGHSKREFLESFLPLRNGIPSPDTFSRVFRLLDLEESQKWFLGFMSQFAQGCAGVLAVDGKTLRPSYDRAGAKSPLHLVLEQLALDGKSNEITAVPQLLEMLALPGMVVTADAMHCQRRLSQQVLDQGADYVLALKGNSGVPQRLCAPVSRRFGHGRGTGKPDQQRARRIETRTANISRDVAWLQEKHQWPGLAAVGKITASRQGEGHSSVESRYYLLGRAFSPERSNMLPAVPNPKCAT